MKTHDIKTITWLMMIGITIGCSSRTTPALLKADRAGDTVIANKKIIGWEAFDPSSTIGQLEIRKEHLQGAWTAYQGAYLHDGNTDAMQLTKPALMEVRDDTYRRDAADTFARFIIRENLIIKGSEAKADTGVINKITSTELTISWKDKTNYTRYYYTK